MKTSRYQFFVAALGVLSALSASALAQEFSQTTASKRASLTQGFAQASLPALHRAAGEGQAAVSSTLLGKFCPDCQVTSQKQGGNLQIGSERISLSIAADATAADFRDLSVEARSHSLAKPLIEKMSAAALEQAGRAFIASKLTGLIVLGSNEALVPVLTDYRVEGIQELSTGIVTRSVAANRVVFGRTLQGVPVVGNGSTVVVTFANDGSVESFHYDWPKYEAATTQNLVTVSTLLDRVQQAVSAHTGIAPAFTVQAPAITRAAAGPIDLNTDTKLQSMQCGFYDAGAAAGHAQVQPGCVYHAVFESSTGVRQGYAGAVPAGLQFQPDAKWAETQILK